MITEPECSQLNYLRDKCADLESDLDRERVHREHLKRFEPLHHLTGQLYAVVLLWMVPVAWWFAPTATAWWVFQAVRAWRRV